MSEKRVIEPGLLGLLALLSFALLAAAACAQLVRIADALERAYPAQEQKP